GSRRRRPGRPGSGTGSRHVPPPEREGLNLALRLVSLALLIAAWYAGSQLSGARLLPGPQAVGLALMAEARSGALAFNLGATLARVAVSCCIAMARGGALGRAMGRCRVAAR